MAYAPTGYKPGRPRKGEIRPETPGGKAAAEWRAKNHDRALELGRAQNERFREQNPWRWAEIQRAVTLRRKGWGKTTLAVTDEGDIRITYEDANQVILAQLD